MKKSLLICPFVVMGMLLVFTAGCKKDSNSSNSSNSTNGKTTAVFNSSLNYGTLTDQDGNVYKTITIGTQTWMAENLRTTKYNDGTSIPNVTDGIKWGNLSTAAYCNINNTADEDTIATYGRLYNWYAINTGMLAPKGWHVPTYAECQTLINYLGGENVDEGKLKEAGTTHWASPNTGATNSSGFTSVPAGFRPDYDNGTFEYIGEGFLSFSATEYDDYNAYNGPNGWFTAAYESGDLICSKSNGLSVRCIKDSK